MIASSDHKFVLLCNPKTATTAFEAAYGRHVEMRLGPMPKWKHINYRKFKEIFGDYFENSGCDIYVVIRHPISTLVSWYSYRSRPEIASPSHGSHVNYTGNLTFEQFAEEWAKPRPASFARVTNFKDFCATSDGTMAPIRYFKYEDLNRLNRILSEKVKKTIELPKVNKSSSGSIAFDKEAVSRMPRMAGLIEAYEKIRFE